MNLKTLDQYGQTAWRYLYLQGSGDCFYAAVWCL